jgi:hypothetical protein
LTAFGVSCVIIFLWKSLIMSADWVGGCVSEHTKKPCNFRIFLHSHQQFLIIEVKFNTTVVT